MGFRDLFRRGQEPPAEQQRLSDEQLAELRATARSWVATGFRERGALAEEIADFLDDIEVSEAVKLAAAERVVEEEWARRLAEQASWTGPSDYDRLAAAFEELAQEGILGRMDFTCCQTCGTAEIDDERTAKPAAAEGEYAFHEWGYTFFHQQDSERLLDEDALLYLSFGTFRPAPGLGEELLARARAGDKDARRETVRLSDIAVGERVVAVLTEAGLTVDWDADNRSRIAVTGLDWRKPLPG